MTTEVKKNLKCKVIIGICPLLPIFPHAELKVVQNVEQLAIINLNKNRRDYTKDGGAHLE